MLDGDGGFYVTYSYKKARFKGTKNLPSGQKCGVWEVAPDATIEWQGNASYVVEAKALLLMHIFLYAINSKANYVPKKDSAYQV